MIGEHCLICIVKDPAPIQAEANKHNEVYDQLIKDILTVAQGLVEDDLQFRTDGIRSIWFDGCKKPPTNPGWRCSGDVYRPDKRIKAGKEIAKLLKDNDTIPTVSKFWADMHDLFKHYYVYPEPCKMRHVYTLLLCNKEADKIAILYPDTESQPASDEVRAKLEAYGELISFGEFYDNYRDTFTYEVVAKREQG